jgi:hypothetical protein
MEDDCKIPNIIHFVFGLREQTQEFCFVFYMAIKSALVVNRPEQILFHYHYEPYGYWWDLIKKEIVFIQIPLFNKIGTAELVKYVHIADLSRLIVLKLFGGTYLDIDTISVKPLHSLRNNNVVMAKEYNYGLCNAVIMSEQNSAFIDKWLQDYDQFFKPDGWGEVAVIQPFLIQQTRPDIPITVLEQDYFFYPGCNEFMEITNPIEGGVVIPTNLTTLHLWNNMRPGFFEALTPDFITDHKNTLYSALVNNAFLYMTPQEKQQFREDVLNAPKPHSNSQP